jgi:hypothetical protein
VSGTDQEHVNECKNYFTECQWQVLSEELSGKSFSIQEERQVIKNNELIYVITSAQKFFSWWEHFWLHKVRLIFRESKTASSSRSITDPCPVITRVVMDLAPPSPHAHAIRSDGVKWWIENIILIWRTDPTVHSTTSEFLSDDMDPQVMLRCHQDRNIVVHLLDSSGNWS